MLSKCNQAAKNANHELLKDIVEELREFLKKRQAYKPKNPLIIGPPKEPLVQK
jgi:hypothetical protein